MASRLEVQHQFAAMIYCSWAPTRIFMRPVSALALDGDGGQQMEPVIAPADPDMMLRALVEAKLLLRAFEDGDERANRMVNRILEQQAEEQRRHEAGLASQG